MAHQAQWPGVIHHAAEDTFDQDIRRAMAESLAIHNSQCQQTAWHNGSSPDADTDDDLDLQRVLALSMQTFEAEQRQEQLRCQSAVQEPRQPNKRSHSPAPADTHTKRPQPADADTALAKRQRSGSAQAPSQDPGTAALVALQELAARAGADVLLALHHAPDSQHRAPQQQQQDRAGVLQGALLATCQYRDNAAPAAAEGNPAGLGLGRSGSVENLNPLAGGAAGGSLSDLGGVDDLGLYDWSGDTVSGSGIAGGSAAGADAEDRGDYDHVVDQGTWHQPQQVLLQQLQQEQAVLAGRGSKVSDVGARRLYQQGEAVWWTNPLTCFCHPAIIFGADTSALPAQQGAERRYIVDVQQYAVRYIEASTSELLPQLYPGELVWCKPAMALAQQFNDKDAQQQQQQQQHLAVQASGLGAGRTPWVVAPWVLGVVEMSKVHNGVPVLQVRLTSGGSCWFPVIHVDKVTEVGESSSAAEARALQQVAVAGEPAPAPVGGDDDGDDDAHQQQQQDERNPQQQQQPQQCQQQQQQQAHLQQEQQACRHHYHQHHQQQHQHGQCDAPAAAAADSPTAADNRSGPVVQHLQHCWSAPGNQGSEGDGSTGSVHIDGMHKDSSASASAVVTAPVLAAGAGAAGRQRPGCVAALPLAAAAPAVSHAVHEEVGDSADLPHQAEGAGDTLELCAANTYASKVPQ